MIDAAEALTNAIAGLFVSLAATYYALPVLFGLAPSLSQSAGMTAFFFAISFTRSWVIRAAFRRMQ